MNPQDEHRWSRMDGDAGPEEAACAEHSFSGADGEWMAREREMDRLIAEMLSAPVPGADEAWKAALARVAEHEPCRKAMVRRRRRAWFGVPVALAAAALIVVSVVHFRTETPPPWFLNTNTLETDSHAPSQQRDEMLSAVRDMLRDRDMRMAFDPKNALKTGSTPYRLVSVRGGEYDGEQVVELHFMCGARPANIIITNCNGNAAREINRAAGRGTVHAVRPVGDWLVSVVGSEAPDELLSLLEPVPPAPQGATGDTPPLESSTAISTDALVAAPSPGSQSLPGAVQAPQDSPIAPEQQPPTTNNLSEPARAASPLPPLT